MPKTKNPDLTKTTLNLRTGDMIKLGELFPNAKPSVSLRDLVSAFVDKYYKDQPSKTVPLDINL